MGIDSVNVRLSIASFHGCSSRQLRLFAVACADLVHANDTDIATAYADKRCSYEELVAANTRARHRFRRHRTAAFLAAWNVTDPDNWYAASSTFNSINSDSQLSHLRPTIEAICSDILHPLHLDTHNAVIRQITQDIYDRQAWSEIGILADALEDNGCTDDMLLSHLRDPNQTHKRGCWALESCR